ncbi:MAG: YeeE/YedE family protein [Opitutaceae bacterium]|nr:YeeE/YedE family protein [Opitutaceae bacterium]
MTAPLFKYGLFGDEISLIVAFGIGIAFGFVLERAGFGNARVLAAQFYFRDLRVLKVMFTAIVTAMTGVYVLSRMGVVDLSLVYLTPTFLWPQIVGGLILGVGFVIGGYCPGTSCVSAATGRIDGIVYVLGMIFGLIGFAEIYPMVENFAHSSALGQITLSSLFKIPYGVLVFAVVVMAVVAFVGAEWAETKFGGKKPDADSLLAPAKTLAPSRLLAGGIVGLGVIAAVSGDPYRGPFARVDTRELALNAGTKADHISVDQLADWLVQGRNDFLLVDVREPAEFAAYHIPEAINVPLAALSPDIADRTERIVFYSDGSIHSAQAWLLLKSLGYSNAYMLFGGLEEWKDSILFPRLAADATPEQKAAFDKRAATAAHFGGAAQTGVAPATGTPTETPKLAPPPPPAGDGAAPAAVKKKKKEGC